MLFLGIGTKKELSLLDKAGVNFSVKTNLGNIAFDYALKNGNLDAIKYILENKKECLDYQHGLVMKSCAINTPVDKFNDILVSFKSHDVDINAITPSTGMCALHYLSLRANKDEISYCFDLLVKNGADPKLKDKKGKAPERIPTDSPPKDTTARKREVAEGIADDSRERSKNLKVWVNGDNELVIGPATSPSQPSVSEISGSKEYATVTKK